MPEVTCKILCVSLYREWSWSFKLLIENGVDNSDCSGYTLVPPILFVQEMTGPLDLSI